MKSLLEQEKTDEKRSVVLVAPVPPPYGGISNWTKMIMEYSRENTNVEIFSLDISPKKRVTEGRNLLSRVFASGFKMLNELKELKAFIRKNRINIIHLTTSGSLALIRDYFFSRMVSHNNAKLVYHIRFGRVPEISRRRSLEFRFLSSVIKKSFCTIAIDENTYDTLKQHFPNKKIMFVPNPFDFKKIQGINSKHRNTQKRIIYVGWVIKSKGIEDLINAWNLIKSNYPEYSLDFVGPIDENYRNKLQDEFELSRVNICGEKENSVALEMVAASEIFVLPSHTEGFPNSVLEAMALQKPIIATNVGAIPFMLSDNSGIVVQKKRIDELSNSIKLLLDDKLLRDRISENAKKRAANFSIDSIFLQYEKIWFDK